MREKAELKRAPTEAGQVLQAALIYADALDVLSDTHALGEYEAATSDKERTAIRTRYERLAAEAETGLRHACLNYKTAYENSFWK